jgi:hypothetical protein
MESVVAFVCGDETKVESVEVKSDCLHRFVVQVAGLCCGCHVSPATISHRFTGSGMDGQLSGTLSPSLGFDWSIFEVTTFGTGSPTSVQLVFDVGETKAYLDANPKALRTEVFSESSIQGGSCVASDGTTVLYKAHVTYQCGTTTSLLWKKGQDPCVQTFTATYRNYCCPGTAQVEPYARQACPILTSSLNFLPEEADEKCEAMGMQVCTTEQLSTGMCCNSAQGSRRLAVSSEPSLMTSTTMTRSRLGMTGCNSEQMAGLSVRSFTFSHSPGVAVSSITVDYHLLPNGTQPDPLTWGSPLATHTVGTIDLHDGEFISYIAANTDCGNGIFCGLEMTSTLNRSLSMGASMAQLSPAGATFTAKAQSNMQFSGFEVSAELSTSALWPRITGGLRSAICYTPCGDPQIMLPLYDPLVYYKCPYDAYGSQLNEGLSCEIHCPSGLRVTGPIGGRVSCTWGRLALEGGASCDPQLPCFDLPTEGSSALNRTYEQLIDGTLNSKADDTRWAPESLWKVT